MPSLEGDPAYLRLDEAAAAIAAAPQEREKNIQTLSAWEKSFLHPGSELGDQKFLTAVVIATSLHKMAQYAGTDPASVAHLLASVDDVHIYTTTDTFKELLDSEFTRSSPLLRFLIQEMIYRQARTQDNELERRLAFMKLFDRRSDDQVTALLTEIASTSVEVAVLVAKTCTRTFLERLYMMMTSVQDVLETRMKICSWLLDHEIEPDDRLSEERDALERELADLDARSDLDSTRVHVDEDALREWFNETQLANAKRYTQTVLAEGATAQFGSLLNFYSSMAEKKSDPDEEEFLKDSQIGSEFIFANIFDATLKVFALDRTFGLDAYLSRRIRHGTLSGHVITPVARILSRLMEVRDSREEDREPDDISGINFLVQDWRAFLGRGLDEVRRDVIQIKTLEHPKGLILANWRTAVNITYVDATIGRVRSRVVESDGAYDMFSDIHALCWDCLEPDLAQLRMYMLRKFLPSAVQRLDELWQGLSPRERYLASSLFLDLKATLEARVQEICGWFIRPVFRRDQYSLKVLIKSTLSIVRELDEHYKFTEAVPMNEDIDLNRVSFDVFADALFVLIGNAAKHGKPDGHITVSANPVEESNNLILLRVTSEFADAERRREGLARIEAALIEGGQHTMDRAAVEEGFSGPRKLAGLLKRVRSPDAALRVSTSERDFEITFCVTLPAEITLGASLT
jgi:hypothetical protein